MPNQGNYTDYWPYPTFSTLGVDQQYIVETAIIPAEDLLRRFSGFEPFEMALAINNSILFPKLNKPCDFPRPFLLCKTRRDTANNRPVYFLLEALDLFPFQYRWENDNLIFDFTGIVFKESDILTLELSAVENDFNLPHAQRAPKAYRRLSFLKEYFPEEGPKTVIEALLQEISTAQKGEHTTGPVQKKDMSKANEKKRSHTEARWKQQFSSGIAAALFCLEYKVKPSEIGMELRLYQSDEILVHNPEADEIKPIMDKIITFDKIISKIKSEED